MKRKIQINVVRLSTLLLIIAASLAFAAGARAQAAANPSTKDQTKDQLVASPGPSIGPDGHYVLVGPNGEMVPMSAEDEKVIKASRAAKENPKLSRFQIEELANENTRLAGSKEILEASVTKLEADVKRLKEEKTALRKEKETAERQEAITKMVNSNLRDELAKNTAALNSYSAPLPTPTPVPTAIAKK